MLERHEDRFGKEVGIETVEELGCACAEVSKAGVSAMRLQILQVPRTPSGVTPGLQDYTFATTGAPRYPL